MCGIAGYYGKDTRISEGRIQNCLGLMKNRGPDSDGVFRDDHVLLLASRLAIVDLSRRANQPLSSEKAVIVFNGEVYNYRELQKGFGIDPCGDVETLFILLQREKIRILDRVDGMFAFAYYDRQTYSLSLVRDRFGEKPLHYYEDKTGFYFGSEPKYIACLLGRKLEINYDQINRYVLCGYRSLFKGEDTFFKGLLRVKPGWGLAVKPDQKILSTYYWRPPKFNPDKNMTFEDAAKETKRLLIRSVERKLTSDVPVAFSLSGGIDSNSIAGIASSELGKKVTTFSVISDDKRYDESRIVRKVVDDSQFKWIRVYPSFDNSLNNLRKIIEYHESPLSTITHYVNWQLMKGVHENGYKVIIGGSGGDELFAGYYDHHLYYLRSLRDDLNFWAAMGDWLKYVKPLIRNLQLWNVQVGRQHLYYSLLGWILENVRPEAFDEADFCSDELRNRMLNELFYETMPVMLHEDDLNAMQFSVENRTPFLDRKLFEFSLTIPTKLLIRNGYGKAVLREAMKGIVPGFVLKERRKTGFNIGIQEVFNFDDPAFLYWLFGDCYLREIMDFDQAKRTIEQRQFDGETSKFLFGLISAKMFLEIFG